MEGLTFGEYLRKLREDRKISINKFIKDIGVSKTYLIEVEKGIMKPPTIERQCYIAEYLNLAQDEKTHFFDMAAYERHELPADIITYVNNNPHIVSVFRKVIKQQ